MVSVLMTAFNREKYIHFAIDSVISSSYENLELIIVDDKSTDNTAVIAQEYAAKDPRVRVHINEKNLGDYPNRNRAASYAIGKYLKYLDSDDYVYPWGLELMVQMMERFPECGWGLCSLKQDFERPFPFFLTNREAYEYNYLGPGLFHKAPLSSIIRRDVFEAVGGFSPIRMVGDHEMWHKLALKYKVLLMPEGIVWNREHDAQEVKSRFKYVPDYEKIMIHYLRANECPLENGIARAILRKKHMESGWDLVKSIIKCNPKKVKIHFARWRSYYE